MNFAFLLQISTLATGIHTHGEYESEGGPVDMNALYIWRSAIVGILATVVMILIYNLLDSKVNQESHFSRLGCLPKTLEVQFGTTAPRGTRTGAEELPRAVE